MARTPDGKPKRERSQPRRGPGSEWIARVPGDVRERLDAAIDDDGPSRRSAAVIYRELGLEAHDVSLRAIQGYCTLRRKRRDNAAVGGLVKAMVSGQGMSLDDIQAVALGKLAEALQGKIKAYEAAQIVAVLDRRERTRITQDVDDRKRIDWEERRAKAKRAADEIETKLKEKGVDQQTVDSIRRDVFGVVD